jgi:DNA-binding CsgD family transcriptional regulator
MGADTPRPTPERPALTPAATSRRDLVHNGAELVELSERFYHGIFVAGLIFIGLAAAAALALLPLRDGSAGYLTSTVLLTGLLLATTPIAVRHAAALHRLLQRSFAAQSAMVLLSTALIVYPLRSELWWPSCAILMLTAILVGLRRVLGYCLVVLSANLIAHAIAGDLGDTPPVSIIGLWIGYVFWCSAFAIFPDRLAAHVLRLNVATAAPRNDVRPRHDADATLAPDAPPATSAGDPPDVAAAPSPPVTGRTTRLTARQLQVVALLADGLRYDEVAACLAITSRQVQRHVGNAVERLGVRNANELVAIAVAEGVVPRPA